jgi:hypothetical protein
MAGESHPSIAQIGRNFVVPNDPFKVLCAAPHPPHLSEEASLSWGRIERHLVEKMLKAAESFPFEQFRRAL